MSRDNVVPFRPASRDGMARRGAPDKRPAPSRALELECPRCAAVLRLDLEQPAPAVEVFCVECESVIPLAVGDRADLG